MIQFTLRFNGDSIIMQLKNEGIENEINPFNEYVIFYDMEEHEILYRFE